MRPSGGFFFCHVDFQRPFRARVTDHGTGAGSGQKSAGHCLWRGLRGRLGRFQTPYQRAARNPHHQVLPGRSIHPLAQAWLAVLGNQPRIVKLRHQIIQIMVRQQNHVAAPPAVAAAGTAFGAISFAQKGHAAFAAVARASKNLDFIYKHRKDRSGRADAAEEPLYPSSNKKGEAFPTSPARSAKIS